MLNLHFEEAGDISLRPATFAAFAAWYDATARKRVADAAQNLAIDCAATPGPEDLASLFEDFGFLPESITSVLLDHVGAPAGGAGVGYPMVRLKDARAAHSRVAELRTASAMEGASPALARELAELEPALLPLELLDAAERVSRRAMLFTTPAGLLAFRPPPRGAAADYVDGIAAFQSQAPDASYLGAGRTLLLACAISPAPDVLAASIESFPALTQWIPPVLQEAGAGGKAQARP